jgi:uncharacterized protein (TIGR02001 family)
MRKSLITTAVLGALAAPAFVFAADAAPAPDLTVAYNVGLYSQYIFRGLTQTNHDAALQGGVDLTHSSGFYLGAWGSNVSWLTDGNKNAANNGYYTSGGSLEIDIYGGYRYAFGDTGLGIDVGALQYYYQGHRNKTSPSTIGEANTTELYAALNYNWVQAKISSVVSKDAWGNPHERGTYYAELNVTPPISDLLGVKDGLASGVSGIVHVARQGFDKNVGGTDPSYTDYKLGLQKAFSNGVNVGGYWTYANGKDNNWVIDGKNIGESTGTVFVQKTF